MNIILKAAKVIDPSSQFNNQIVDIEIRDGIISKIGAHIDAPEDFQTIVLDDLHVSCGWMDSSVCLGEPGFEERETISHGLDVAAKCGFTAIALEPLTNPVVDNQTTIGFIQQKSVHHPTTLYPIGALTKQFNGQDLAELYDMHNAGAIAFGDYKIGISNANVLKIALQYTQDFSSTVIAYAQDKTISGKGVANEGVAATMLGLKPLPELAEDLQVARNLFLLEYTGGKMHIPTVSTLKSIELIKAAKQKGLAVTCSVAAHTLCLTDEQLNDFDTRFKVLPPLRDQTTQQALIQAVLDGTIDCITSEHNPLDIEHKKVEFDVASFGTIGLETIYGALQNILPVEVIVDKLTAARDIFNLDKPSIAVGQQANLSLFTTSTNTIFTKNDILSKSKNAIFLKANLKGKAYGSYAKGKLTLK